MTKIVIHPDFGGWGEHYTKEAEKLYKELGGKKKSLKNAERTDAAFVAVVEKMEGKVFADYFRDTLKVVEIPDDVEWDIHDYDGAETIADVNNRYWS